MFDRLFRKPPPSLEHQLEQLAACGVKLLPDGTPESLLDEWSREDFEKDPYRTLEG